MAGGTLVYNDDYYSQPGKVYNDDYYSLSATVQNRIFCRSKTGQIIA